MVLTVDLLLAFAVFAFVTCITPGPNNTMLLSSGVNFGFNRSIPHILGISCGFGFMVLAVGLGLGAVFKAYPLLYTVLRFVGAAYLLYLAWKIYSSGPMSDEEIGNTRPQSYWGAAAFQWVNPKAWVMAVGAISAYTPLENYFTNVVIIAAVFGLMCAPTSCIWAGFGSLLRSYLKDPRWLKLFNTLMALLLVLSMYPLLFEH
ncbi:LysE family translocator [Pseudomonas sp. NA-150]|uniref:LysE family translocator n=1 Tax=Pseudomonas sp. NA-150 TaxID=3367525 RepID=UPI0037CAC052